MDGVVLINQSTARPQVFSLDASESTASAGTLATYKWTFGDETMGAMPSVLTTATAQMFGGMVVEVIRGGNSLANLNEKANAAATITLASINPTALTFTHTTNGPSGF